MEKQPNALALGMNKGKRIIEERVIEALPNLLAHFTVVPDPRAQNVQHRLADILAIALCAVICGANTCTEIAQYGQGKEGLLRKFLKLENGIPSHDTFRRVFRVLAAEAWQGVFFAWTRQLVLEQPDSPTEVRAVDGKVSRASGLPSVSVWAREHHVVLAQEQVPDKSNDITVIPLLAVRDIVGTTVTIDAVHKSRLPGRRASIMQTMV